MEFTCHEKVPLIDGGIKRQHVEKFTVDEEMKTAAQLVTKDPFVKAGLDGYDKTEVILRAWLSPRRRFVPECGSVDPLQRLTV